MVTATALPLWYSDCVLILRANSAPMGRKRESASFGVSLLHMHINALYIDYGRVVTYLWWCSTAVRATASVLAEASF